MTETTIDFAAIKKRQQGAWSTGNYAVVGTTLQIVGETLCEALDLRSGSRVLDVCAGNGNATLAAARRFTEQTLEGHLLWIGGKHRAPRRINLLARDHVNEVHLSAAHNVDARNSQ